MARPGPTTWPTKDQQNESMTVWMNEQGFLVVETTEITQSNTVMALGRTSSFRCYLPPPTHISAAPGTQHHSQFAVLLGVHHYDVRSIRKARMESPEIQCTY